MTTPPRLNAVGVVASDLPRTLAFYRALGCDLPERLGPGEGHIEVDLGGVRLMFDTESVMRSFDPDWSGTGPGRVSLAVQCASAEDVDWLHEMLSALGAGSRLAPFDAPWGQRYATVLDPDGTRVDLYAVVTPA